MTFLVLINTEYVEVSRSPTSHLPFPSSTTLDQHSYDESNKTPDKVTVTSVITRTTTTVVSIIATTECNSISIPTSVIRTPTLENSVVVEPTVDAVAGN